MLLHSEYSSRAVFGLALAASLACAQPPSAPSDLFAGTSQFKPKAASVIELDLAGSALQSRLANTPVAALATNVSFVSLREYDFAVIAQFAPEDIRPYDARLTDGGWNCFIRTSFRSSFNDICQRTQAPGHSTELALIDTTPSRLVFLHAAGTLSLAQLQQISDTLLNAARASP